MNLAARVGAWSARHRKKAILGWLGLVVVAVLAGQAIGMTTLKAPDNGNGDSQKADRLINAHFPKYGEERVLLQSRVPVRSGDRRFNAAVVEVARGLERVRYVRDVRTPLKFGGGDLVSRDGRSVLVTFKLLGERDQFADRVDPALAATAAVQRRYPELRIEQIGDASFERAVTDLFENDFQKAERTSLPVTMAVLLVAFGALVAAGLPLLLGITAVATALGLLGPLSGVIPLEDTVKNVVLLIGLAVGVDYSMFYLRRKIEERAAGRSNEEALGIAAATSGRAVLVSGLTVMTAMAGMFFAGNAVFSSFAVGTILVVAVSLLGSATVLPAVMSKLGDKLQWGRIPLISSRRRRGESRAWGFVIDRVLRYPAVSLTLGAGFLLALALPALGLRTVNPSVGALPHDIPIMKTYDRVQAAFPGDVQSAIVAVRARDVTSPATTRGIERMTRQAIATRHLSPPVATSVSGDRKLAVVSIALWGNGTDKRSVAGLNTLRDRVIPATVNRTPGAQAYVTGPTAQSKDFDDAMRSHLPIVFAFVLGLAFVLLLVTFRSIVIPITAIVLNMLSVGASYGVLKLVFQDGHGEKLLGFQSIGGVVSWLPLFLFVILFGLSMDYHVLILSRIREGVDRGLSTEDAVSRALKSTAGVITSAAVVMVAVFAIFGTLGFISFKMMGVGLAAAVLIDATIVRAMLVPATMKLLGKWNWYLPQRPHWAPPAGHGRAPAARA